ncbi:MAG: hypothetical protein IBX50_17325 [Marinospirillum sp.]|nr:hypothetical protein [Marinospirillum sp.]MBE0508453.1 hypothetical protein [Marinospirillum sp.]
MTNEQRMTGLRRLGKRVVNVSVFAWQGDRRAEPVAQARAHLVWPEQG